MAPQHRHAAADFPQEAIRALELQSIGNIADAEVYFRSAMDKHPRDVRVRRALGAMLTQEDRLDEAAQILREAVNFQPANAEAWNDLGVVLLRMRRAGEAVSCFERAVKLRPDLAEAHIGLGGAMSMRKKWREAERAFVAALKIRPDLAVVRHGLAGALQHMERYREAFAVAEDLLRSAPHDETAQYIAHQALSGLKDYARAEALFRDLAGRCPQSGSAWLYLSFHLAGQGKYDEAGDACGKSMELMPDFSAARLAMAKALLGKGAFAEADEQIQKSLECASDDLNELEALLSVFADMSCEAAVEPLCRRLLELDPGSHMAASFLVVALGLLGRAREAAPLRKRIMEAAASEGKSYLICTATMHQSEAPEALLEQARAYGRGLLPEKARKLAAGHQFKNRRGGGRLRVGFVSHEVYGHSVAAFLEPVITRLDRDEFEVFLYGTNPAVDEVSKRLMAGADRFADISALSPLERAKCLRQDNIDIAVDTTGYTSGCHFESFAHRAAPVQAHYIGYFGTSGLERMDYFLGDQVLNRPEDDRFFCEKIWRLPCFWTAWQERFKAPDIEWTPAADGGVTLGSCNALYKLGSKCLDLWGEIMLRLPSTRLLLKNRHCSDPALRAHIIRTLEGKGIAPGRVAFMVSVPGWREHMAVYDRIDLCLDPLPFNGCTTAFEALWMGVPMIALEGTWMGGRVGMAMLRALGHPEWVAATDEEYIAKAVALAGDVDLRRALRVRQRDKMRASPLCDYDGVARALEDAFRRMHDKA